MAYGKKAPLLQAVHISQTKAGFVQFCDLDFKLMPGETYCILCSRPTVLDYVLSLIERKEKADKGELYIFGKPAENNNRNLYGGRIMIMGRETAVINVLSVIENIYIHDSLADSFSSKKKFEAAKKLISETGLSIDPSKAVSDCSDMEKKAIELLRICAVRPSIVVIFEAASMLSVEDGNRLANILDKLKETGSGILYLTSRIEEALTIADRMTVLEKDIFREISDIDSIKRDPNGLVRKMLGWETLSSDEENGKVEVLKSIINVRESWIKESQLKKLLIYYTDDMAKVFKAGSAVIYLFDKESESIIDFISEKEEVIRCSKMKNKIVADLLKFDDMINVFHEKDLVNKEFFSEKNMIKSIICYSIWIDEKQQALIQLAFTEHKELDHTIREYLEIFAKEIRLAVENLRLLERSTLLQESHHRIKNNLQTMANLLYLQKTDGKSKEDRHINHILDSAMSRIKSIASVHNLLSIESGRSSTIVNLRRIISEVSKLYQDETLTIKVDMENISVPYNRAASIALLVNELINNSVKYAYPADEKNKIIKITGSNLGTVVRVIVRDFGKGITDNTETSGSGLGMTIIDSIVGSMKGKISYHSHDGLEVTIELPRDTLMPIIKNDGGF